MLNPSTADEEQNDPTVERQERRARQAGLGGLYVLNLFAFRSTDPKLLPLQRDPIGQDNNDAIRRVCSTPNALVVCGWGKHGRLMSRDYEVTRLLDSIPVRKYCLGQNNDGTPKHPLYVPYSTLPTAFEP
jgi:hypothetical protein